MDIPKAPAGSSLTTATEANTSLSVDKLVDISQVKLVKNTPYSARVVSSLESFLANSQHPTPPQNPIASSSNAISTPSQGGSNWIILVQGNLVHISSQEALEPDQMLRLMLTDKGLTLLQKPIPQESLSALKTALSPEQVETTLKSMNQLLTRQTTLESALMTLLQANTKTSSTNASTNTINTLTSLLSNLPQKSALLTTAAQAKTSNAQDPLARTSTQNAAPNELPPQISSEQIKRLITNSGLSLESSLVQDTHKRAQFIQQLAQLASLTTNQNQNAEPQQLNNELNAILSGQTIQKSPLSIRETLSQTLRSLAAQVSQQNIQPSNQAPSSQGPGNQNQNTAQHSLSGSSSQMNSGTTPASITGINPSAVNPNLLAPSQSSSSSNTTSPQSNNSATASHSDIKALLVLLSASLIGKSDELTQEFSKGVTSPELLNAPFNFPPLLSKNLLKAEAILADQELTTGQLLKLLASMLNRLQFNQLNSLYQSQMASNENNNVQSWFFELPIITESKQLELFNLRIDKEEQQESESEDSSENKTQIQWRISLSFDFEDLGAIYIQANITPPSVSSTIWANNSKTLSLINKEQGFFRERLTQLGLDVGDIRCQYGQPKTNKAKLDRSLIDVNA